MDKLTTILSSYIEIDTLIQLSLAALVGLIIGFERELRKKPTGVKTLIVISVASALLTIISRESIDMYANLGAKVVQDPLRLPAQIVSGIGFLGAGIIWKRSNDVISGLTTAAIVWGVGGLGIAIGAGFISEAILALLFFLVGVEVIPWLIEKMTGIQMNEKVITMKITIDRKTETKEIMKIAKENKIKIKNVEVLDKKDDEKQVKIIKIRGYIPKKLYVTSISDELSKLDEIKEIEIKE